MTRRWSCVGVAALWAAGLLASAAPGQALAVEPPSPTPRKFVLLAADQLRWEDFQSSETGNLRRLAELGALGLMNVRTARAGPEGGYLTLGAGSRAYSLAPAELGVASLEGFAFGAEEEWQGRGVRALYHSLAGGRVGRNKVAHLGLPVLLRQNAKLDYTMRPGLLGSLLTQAGLRVACLGNADTSLGLQRPIAALAMDETGLVPLGDVGPGLNRPAPDSPFGEVMDESKFLERFERLLSEADFVAADIGDLGRLAAWRPLLSDEAEARERGRALGKLDRAVGWLLKRMETAPGWALLLVSPSARPVNDEVVPLTPVIFYSPARRGGTLTSPSTRSPWIVVNTDLAPTVLAYFGLVIPQELIGRPLEVRGAPGAGNLEKVTSLSARWERIEPQRRVVLKSAAVAVTFLLVFCAVGLLLGEAAPRWSLLALRGLLLGWVAFPLALLAGAEVVLATPLAQGLFLAVTTALIALAAAAAGKGRSSPFLLCAGLTLLLALDLVSGQELLRFSFLSYSPAAGARYYGIGNEYAGALLAAALLSAAGALEAGKGAARRRRWLAALGLLLLLVVVGHPRLGANFGMTIGCGVGFLTLGLYLVRDRPRARELILALGLLAALAVSFVLLDLMLHGAERSHLGRWVQSVRSQGLAEVGNLAARKLNMNWRLIQHTAWTEGLIASLVIFGLALFVRPPTLGRALSMRPWLSVTMWAIALGSGASVLFNDSGVIPGAIALSTGAAVLCYVSFGDGLGLRARGPGSSLEAD